MKLLTDELALLLAEKLLQNDKEHKVITFGRYPQNSADLEENIEWLVLKEDENTNRNIRKGLQGLYR